MTGYSAGSTMIDVNIIKECSKELQISLDRPSPPSKQAKVIEFDSSYREPQAIKLKRKPESSNKAASLKIAGIVITIVLIFGIGASFFYMFRIEQSLNSLKQNNEILMSEDSGKNSEKLSLEIADFEGITEDPSTDEFIAENDQSDDKIAEIIVPENPSDNEIEEYDTIPKSEVKNLAVEDTEKLPLEIADSQGTTEDTSIDKLAEEKDQSDQTIAVINIPEEQPDNEIEEYDTVRKSEAKNLAVEDTQKKSLKNADFDVTKEKITTNYLSVETVENDEKIAGINVSKEQPDNETEESKTDVLLDSQIAKVYVPKRKVSDRKDFLVNDGKQTIAKEVDQNIKRSNSRQSLILPEHKFIIHFKYNSVDLDSQAFEILKEIVEIFSQNSKSEITVEGYADSNGDFNYNKKLSQFRSNIVESYLISQGVAKSNIKAIGLGSQNPIGNNRTRKGRSKNRRVEIKVKIGKNGNSMD
jgi:outer membrane protein OmpA-like peptidoglycan-associated protein